MSQDKIDINYSAEDIEQYFSGSLPADQMHAMEKAALDDLFLAEAMEGYEAMQGKEWKTELIALRKELAVKQTTAKLVPLNRSTGRWWKAAAAILVIGAGTTFTYLYTKDRSSDKEPQQIAQNITPATTADSEKISQPAITVTDNTSIQQPVTAAKPVQTEESKAINRPTTANGNVTPVSDSVAFVLPGRTRQPVQVNNQGTLSNTDLYKKDANITVSKTSPQLNSNLPAAPVQTTAVRADENNNAGNVNVADAEKKKTNQNVVANKMAPLNRSFSAQVVGPDNTPLPFSNIAVKTENFGTYADVKGNFRLVSSDSVLNVEIRSVGYLPRTLTLRSNQAQNKIVLAEDDQALREKTIVKGKDITLINGSHRPRLVKDSVINVEPADGWDNYNTYIANNIELPDDILQNNVHGEIGISFDVKANGSISNIQVDQSKCNDCQELAKRLIAEGPQWKLKKGKKASAKLKVQF